MNIAMLMAASSIGTARKRKLRELYSVATEADAAPNPIFKDGDATAASPPELSFLLDSDILRYVKQRVLYPFPAYQS